MKNNKSFRKKQKIRKSFFIKKKTYKKKTYKKKTYKKKTYKKKTYKKKTYKKKTYIKKQKNKNIYKGGSYIRCYYHTCCGCNKFYFKATRRWDLKYSEGIYEGETNRSSFPKFINAFDASQEFYDGSIFVCSDHWGKWKSWFKCKSVPLDESVPLVTDVEEKILDDALLLSLITVFISYRMSGGRSSRIKNSEKFKSFYDDIEYKHTDTYNIVSLLYDECSPAKMVDGEFSFDFLVNSPNEICLFKRYGNYNIYDGENAIYIIFPTGSPVYIENLDRNVNINSLLTDVIDRLKKGKYLIITGHSMGAAISYYFTVILLKKLIHIGKTELGNRIYVYFSGLGRIRKNIVDEFVNFQNLYNFKCFDLILSTNNNGNISVDEFLDRITLQSKDCDPEISDDYSGDINNFYYCNNASYRFNDIGNVKYGIRNGLINFNSLFVSPEVPKLKDGIPESDFESEYHECKNDWGEPYNEKWNRCQTYFDNYYTHNTINTNTIQKVIAKGKMIGTSVFAIDKNSYMEKNKITILNPLGESSQECEHSLKKYHEYFSNINPD